MNQDKGLHTIVGAVPGSQVSLGGLLQRLRVQGRLRSLVFEALTEQMVQDQARQAGLSVTRAEIQSAADAFRHRHGLSTAADTHTWLSGRGMSADDFEANLEHDLLAAKLRHHLTADRVAGHFAAHQADYERMRLAQLCVGRDDLANELACQVRDEGRDLDAVAAEHGVRLVHSESYRRDLASPLAEALASASPRQLVGPVATEQGFVLVHVEEIETAALDPATHEHLENELFTAWIAERMREARVELS